MKNNNNSVFVLKSFLSLEKGGSEMGQKILDLGEKLPAESANAIFSKYAELSDIARDAEDFVKSEFSDDLENSEKISEELREKMLSKGVEVLNIFHEKLGSIDDENVNEVTDIITESLSKISVDALATLSTFKAARKSGLALSLEDIKNSSFKKRESSYIPEEEIEKMVDIYRDNYSNDFELAENLVEKFKEKFSVKDDSFYTFSVKDQLQAFVRFTKSEEGTSASALNVRSDAKGYSLGNAMMQQALEKESHKDILLAEAKINDVPIDSFLSLGFAANSEYETDMKSNDLIVNIAWDRKLNEKLISKQKTLKELREDTPENILIEEYENIDDFDISRLGEYLLTQKIKNEEGGYTVILEKKPE